MKYSALFILLVIFSCTSNRQKQIIGKDSTAIITVQPGDKAIETAILLAQSSLNEFDSALFSQNPHYNSFALKVRFAYGENNGEHIWLTDITKNKGEYSGVVNNHPEYVQNLKLFDSLKIAREDISDWMYLDNDTLRGGFTIRIMRNRMTDIEKAQFDSSSFYKIEE